MPSCVLKLAVTGNMLGAERLTVKVAVGDVMSRSVTELE